MRCRVSGEVARRLTWKNHSRKKIHSDIFFFSPFTASSFWGEREEKTGGTSSWIPSLPVCVRWLQQEESARIDPRSFIFQTQSSFRAQHWFLKNIQLASQIILSEFFSLFFFFLANCTVERCEVGRWQLPKDWLPHSLRWIFFLKFLQVVDCAPFHPF